LYISIKAKLGILAFFCSFVSVTVVSVVLISGNSSEIKKQTLTQLSETAYLKQSLLTHHLDMIGSIALSLTQNPKIQAVYQGEVDPEARQFLQSVQQAYWGKIHHVYLIDLEGTIILSPNKTGDDDSDHLNSSVAESPFFEMGKKERSITDFFGFSEQDHYHQILFEPVKSDKGVLGVIGFEICIDFMDNFFRDMKHKGEVEVTMVTLQGEQVVNKIADRKSVFSSPVLAETISNGEFVGVTQGLNNLDVYGVYTHNPKFPWILCVEQDAAVIENHITEARNHSMLSSMIVLSLMVLVGVLAAAHISRPLALINQYIIHSAEQHDLTHEIHIRSKDEIGHMARAVTIFLGKIRELIGENKVAANALANTAEELNHGAGTLHDVSGTMESEQKEASKLSESISHQSASLAEQTKGARSMVFDLNRAICDMDQQVECVSSLTIESDSLVVETEKAIVRLRESMETVVGQCQQGVTIHENLNKKIKGARHVTTTLNRSTESIDQIIKVIEKLADQTTLLALNAAIEAEKAGAAGRSFSVVALDIKRLAHQSRSSAEEINQQINQMQENARNVDVVFGEIFTIVDEMEGINAALNDGLEHQIITVDRVSEIVGQESGHLSSLTEGVTSIAAGISQVTSQLDTLVQFLGDVDESAGRSDELARKIGESIVGMGESCRDLAQVAGVVIQNTEEVKKRFLRMEQLVAPYKT